MKNQQVDYHQKLIRLLQEIHKEYPHTDIIRHIHLATLEENLLNLEDKEMCTILTKYKEEISFDNLTEEDMNKLVLDTESLFKEVEWDGELLDEED